MASATTAGHRSRIFVVAALLLAVVTAVGAASAGAAAEPAASPGSPDDPPPLSCIVDEPTDPLGPGFLLDRGAFTTIDHPDAVLETAPFGINSRDRSWRLRHRPLRRPRLPPRPRALHDHRRPGGNEDNCGEDQRARADPRPLRGHSRRVPRLPVRQGRLRDGRRPGRPDPGPGPQRSRRYRRHILRFRCQTGPRVPAEEGRLQADRLPRRPGDQLVRHQQPGPDRGHLRR